MKGRTSTKENKTEYQLRREALGYSRDKASELMDFVSADRLEKIENEVSPPRPEEILAMSNAYQDPELCNYFCSVQCPIGQKYVPSVKIRDLSEIVLKMLSSLNSVERQRDRFIDITADGKIEGEEIKDFVDIQNELEKISLTVEAMQLWVEQMIATGAIDAEAYNACKNP